MLTYLRLADIEKDVLFAFPVHIRAKLENFTDEITERDINKIKMFSMFGFPSFFENEALFTSLFEIKTEGEYGNEKTRTLLLVLYSVLPGYITIIITVLYWNIICISLVRKYCTRH